MKTIIVVLAVVLASVAMAEKRYSIRYAKFRNTPSSKAKTFGSELNVSKSR